MDDDFKKDIENEKTFLSKIVKFELGEVAENKIGLANELTVMIKIYNEQLINLIGLRFDLELMSSLTIAEPNTKTYSDDKMKTKKGLDIKRKGIRIMRDQILQMAELLKGKNE